MRRGSLPLRIGGDGRRVDRRCCRADDTLLSLATPTVDRRGGGGGADGHLRAREQAVVPRRTTSCGTAARRGAASKRLLPKLDRWRPRGAFEWARHGRHAFFLFFCTVTVVVWTRGVWVGPGSVSAQLSSFVVVIFFFFDARCVRRRQWLHQWATMHFCTISVSFFFFSPRALLRCGLSYRRVGGWRVEAGQSR